MARKDMIIIGILVITVGMWATEPLHNIPLPYIAICSVLTLNFPFIGPNYIGDRTANIQICIFVICVMGLGSVFQDASSQDLTQALDDWIKLLITLSDNQFFQYYLAYLFTCVSLWTISATPAAGIVIPQLEVVARQIPLDPFSVALSFSMAGCSVIFPSNSPPMLVTFQLNKITKRDFMSVLLCNTVVTMILLAPLEILYLRLFDQP